VFAGGGQRPGHGIDRPPALGAEVKERIEQYLYTPIWVFMACYRMEFAVTQRWPPYISILKFTLKWTHSQLFSFYT
jgi:hypothetical protein